MSASRKASNVTIHRYKARQLKGSGIAITGRGAVKIFDLIQQAAEKLNLNGFDDYLLHWEKIYEDVYKTILLPFLEIDSLPDGITIGEVIQFLILHNKGLGPIINSEFYAVGYSRKEKRMGLACASSKGNNPLTLQTCYREGLLIFHEMKSILRYSHKLGHPPKTDKEMVDCMQLSFWDGAKLARKRLPSIGVLGGGDVHKTTVYANGKLAVETVGTINEEKTLRAL